MNAKTTIALVSLGLLALSTVPVPAAASGFCAPASCIDVGIDQSSSTVIHYEQCSGNGQTNVQIGLYNYNCSGNGGNGTGPRVPDFVAV